MDHYLTIEKTATAEFKDRGSRFIAYAFPVTDTAIFKRQLVETRKIHPKAVHYCFAYRLGITGDNFRVSDDGEPSGTAGRPILGQIDSKQLTDTAIIVVRYFGGTLLGVPGLINAYKTTASLVLQTIPFVRKLVEMVYLIRFPYSEFDHIMQVIRKYNCTIIEKEIQLFSMLKTGIPKQNSAVVLNELEKICNAEIEHLG